MTTTATDAAPSLNGTAPPPPGDDDGQAAAPVSERIMGLIGIALAAGLLAIGIDLATGGALSRLLSGGTDNGERAGG